MATPSYTIRWDTISILIQNGQETELPVLVTEPYTIRKGDVFRHISPSGGGFGPAKERAPEQVQEDVEAGLLTESYAQVTYPHAFQGE